MKNFPEKIFMFIIALCFVVFDSCDKIEPPYTENNEIIDISKCSIPAFPTLGNVFKKILVEDFTGFKCKYCPLAHIALKNLINTYGDTIVSYAMHVSDYAKPDVSGLFTYDFRTPEGTEIDQTFQVSAQGLPKGMINRTKYEGTVVIPHTSWSIVIQPMLADQPKVAMQIINNYNINDSSFCTHIKMTFIEDITDTLMFFCGLTEDSIIKPQTDYSLPIGQQDVLNYIHMHTFRDGLNGSFGVTINPQKTHKDSTLVKSYYYSLKQKDYVHKNLKIVAYVYKLTGSEVLQSEEKKVK